MLGKVLGLIERDAAALAFCSLAVIAGAYLKGYMSFGASILWVTSMSLVLTPTASRANGTDV
jgi:hypothetical protein